MQTDKTNFQRCAVTVMDTTDPDITFDKAGVCNYVHEYQDYVDNRQLIGKAAKEELSKVLEKVRLDGKNKEYDCIMGLSGGVDSSYLAYLAVKKWGLRPLVVHVDAGWNSELAVNNIENIVQRLGIDLHTLVVNWNEIRDLQRSFIKASVPNCDIPQDHSFIAGLYNEAKKYNIKYILNGGNMATESILPISWGHDAADLIHIKDIHKKFGEVKLKTYPTINFMSRAIINPHIIKYEVLRPLELIDFNKEEAKALLISELGWRDYGGKHYESVFTKFFQAHYLPIKFNFDKRKAHLSSLILSGQMTREDALKELEAELYDPEELERDRDYFIKKLGFSADEWTAIMNDEPKLHSAYKIDKSADRLRKYILPAYKMIRQIKLK